MHKELSQMQEITLCPEGGLHALTTSLMETETSSYPEQHWVVEKQLLDLGLWTLTHADSGLSPFYIDISN